MAFVGQRFRIQTVFSSSIVHRLHRGLCSGAHPASKDQHDIDDKKAKQQKYQELEKLEFRPLYLDAQATTPMVYCIYLKSFALKCISF